LTRHVFDDRLNGPSKPKRNSARERERAAFRVYAIGRLLQAPISRKAPQESVSLSGRQFAFRCRTRILNFRDLRRGGLSMPIARLVLRIASGNVGIENNRDSALLAQSPTTSNHIAAAFNGSRRDDFRVVLFMLVEILEDVDYLLNFCARHEHRAEPVVHQTVRHGNAAVIRHREYDRLPSVRRFLFLCMLVEPQVRSASLPALL